MLTCQQPNRRELEGQTLMFQAAGGEEVNVSLYVTYITAGGFHAALGAWLSNNLF